MRTPWVCPLLRSLTKWSVDSYKVMLQDIKDGKIAIDNNYDNLASTENVTLNIVG